MLQCRDNRTYQVIISSLKEAAVTMCWGYYAPAHKVTGACMATESGWDGNAIVPDGYPRFRFSVSLGRTRAWFRTGHRPSARYSPPGDPRNRAAPGIHVR